MNLSEAVAAYLASLPPEDREESQQELGKLVRWFGRLHPVSGVAAHELENYAEMVTASDIDPLKRLEPVKAFLSYAKREKLTSTNLAVHLRIRKVSAKRAGARATEAAVTLTPKGYAELEAELEALKSERPRIAEELRRAAADKDFAENAPLDAAREQQGQIEARIRRLERTLRSAVIINEADVEGDKVMLGSAVILKDLSSGEELHYTLVNPSEASPMKGNISIASPTGKMLLNRVEGDEVEVTAPGGILRYRIEGIKR